MAPSHSSIAISYFSIANRFLLPIANIAVCWFLIKKVGFVIHLIRSYIKINGTPGYIVFPLLNPSAMKIIGFVGGLRWEMFKSW